MENTSFLIHEKNLLTFLQSHKDNPSYKKTLDSYNKRVFKVSDTKTTYRTINSWDNAGILLGEVNQESKWRKFSLIEVIWIQIIKELRTIGISTHKIKTLKDSIFKHNEDFGDSITSRFGVYLFSINAKRDVMIIVNNIGEGDLALDIEYEMSQREDNFPNAHIVLNLNRIFADFSDSPEYRKRNQHFYTYNKKELEILNAIYNKPNIKEIIIKTENKGFGKIDYKSRFKNPNDVMGYMRDALKTNRRRDIRVTIEPNKVLLLEDTEKA